MSEVHLHPTWRVDCSTEIPLSVPARVVWGQMRDFRHFVTRDPFHTRVDWDGDSSDTHTFILWHGWKLLRFPRVGRILKWREGKGFAFSDLSRRDALKGFPHVYEYRIAATSSEASILRISVRGRWTATWMPRWLVRTWLELVMTLIRGCVTSFFLEFDRALAERDRRPVTPDEPG
jgi:hypothetical protein